MSWADGAMIRVYEATSRRDGPKSRVTAPVSRCSGPTSRDEGPISWYGGAPSRVNGPVAANHIPDLVETPRYTPRREISVEPENRLGLPRHRSTCVYPESL